MDLGKMAVSINKAINAQEVAVKEKHARTCILGTHHEKGALTFWAAVHRLPLSSNAVLCWKFCHVFHKLLRDGHHSVLKDSMRNKADLSDMSRMWGHLSEGYGKLCSIYLKLLITKMEFHSKNPRFPGNLMMTDKQLDEAGENDVNNFFQMTVEMFDYLECELNLFLAVFSSLDMSRSVSVTTAGQCRLAPLIQVILDCSHLYDYIVKLLFKLHSCLPADTLQGHRDRFQEQFRKLKDLFYRSSNLQYFKRLIQIPQLPENPPNFLRASALSEHISPVVVIPLESSSPDNEPSVETEELVDMDTALQPTHVESKFDDLFGTSSASDLFNFNSQNGMYKDDKDRLIEQLSRDIRALKEELETFKAESHRLCQALRGRISELEAELAEQTHLKQQALDEGEFLRAELEDLRRRREDTEKAQRSLTEVEKKAQANEQRYAKLKEKYTELVQSHAELLRKNAEVTRQVTVARAAQDEVESVRREMQEKLKEAQEESQHREKEQSEKLQVLQRELACSREQLGTLRASITSSQQMSTDLSSKIEALEQDKGGLAEVVTQKEAELSVLGVELEQLQSTLSSERESAVKTAEALQNQLNEKESREQALERQLAAERLALLRSSVEEGERIIQDALARLEHPAHIGCTSSADYLVSRSQAALESLNRLQAGRQQYLSDPTDVSELLRAVAQLAHLVGDTIVQGSATSHMAPLEQADMLSEAVKCCGGDALAFLRLLKEEETLGSADSTVLREGLARITNIGEELRPKGLDINQGELGDLVEQELAATSAAVESAAARIEVNTQTCLHHSSVNCTYRCCHSIHLFPLELLAVANTAGEREWKPGTTAENSPGSEPGTVHTIPGPAFLHSWDTKQRTPYTLGINTSAARCSICLVYTVQRPVWSLRRNCSLGRRQRRRMCSAMYALSTLGGYVLTSVVLFKCPSLLHRRKKETFRSRHISHRGGAGENLENTMAAFKHAVELGTDMLELDCHMTKDGEVVVSHDKNLKRSTGVNANISELTYAELPPYLCKLDVSFQRECSCEGGDDKRIPLLREVFDAFPNTPVNIDIKVNNDTLIRKVSKLVTKYNREHLTVWGNSSSQIVEKCYKENPRIPLLFSLQRVLFLVGLFYTGLLPFVPLREQFLEIPMPSIITKLKDPQTMTRRQRLMAWLADTLLMRKALFNHLQARGIQVYVWVLNDEEDFKRAFDLGATGVMTDYPTKLKEFMERNCCS